MTIIIGVDPGGASCGIVVRRAGELLGSTLLEREADEGIARWCHRILAAVPDVLRGGPPDGRGGGEVIHLAVEDVVHPSPHLGISNVSGLLDTAVVVGALIGRWPTTILVRPARHGSHPLRTYPPALVGPREVAGGGKLRHCRSAWDIAHAALWELRIRRAS